VRRRRPASTRLDRVSGRHRYRGSASSLCCSTRRAPSYSPLGRTSRADLAQLGPVDYRELPSRAAARGGPHDRRSLIFQKGGAEMTDPATSSSAHDPRLRYQWYCFSGRRSTFFAAIRRLGGHVQSALHTLIKPDKPSFTQVVHRRRALGARRG
jgi:hypothetical protein